MKVLIISDIHLGIYHNCNPTNNFRLNQFSKLGDRIIEAGKSNGCEELWIAGDFVRKPIQSNKENFLLFTIVNKFCKEFKVVRYIRGQHDISSKSQTTDEMDSILSLINFDKDDELNNFKYMDHKILELDDHRFAFKDWQPDQDFTWCSDSKPEVIIGHYTHSRDEKRFSSQPLIGIEPGDFKLLIFGDIHQAYVHEINCPRKRFEKCTYISIGTPIQGNMGDQPESTAVILNTENLDAKHINLDPDHTRFLRMYYTPVKEEEGYYDDNLTYKVYKPVIKKLLSESKDRKGVLEFDDVDDLINKVILQEGLLSVHSEVLAKNPVYNSIDFDFHLISLDIKGYRSIRDMHIDFTPEQKEVLVLVGQNGSGKSSIIRALQACFMKNRYIKGERSDLPGTDEFYVNVKFTYGGKHYEIQKGDKSDIFYAIDGKVRKCNITDLENEIESELPFIKYLDLLFINADSPNLADKFSDTRRIQLIKKFYRLDRLSSFKDTATEIYKEESEGVDDMKTELSNLEFSRDEKSRELEKLNESLDGVDEPTLQKEYDELKLLKEKADAYDAWKKSLDSLEGKREVAKEKSKLYKDKILSDEEVKQINAEIESKNSRIKEIDSELRGLDESRDDYKDAESELQKVVKDGKEVKGKLDSLERSICPTCGQRLNAGEYEILKEKYSKEREGLLEQYNEIKGRIDAMKSPKEIDEERSRLKEEQNLLKVEFLTDSTKLKDHQANKKQYDEVEIEIAQLLAKILELKGAEIEELVFSSDSLNRIIELTTILKDCSRARELISEVKELNCRIDKKAQDVESKQKELEKYVSYIDAMGDAGIVMKSILQVLADKFNEEETGIAYRVESGVYRNKPYVTFDQYMQVSSKERIYDALSSGQKVKCDLDFLSRLLVNRVGIIVLDEFLKFSDDDSAQELQKKVRDLNANTIIVSTHDNNYVDYTRRMYLSLASDGGTVVD